MSLTGGKRKVNKSLKAWVAFVKKVQKEEKLSYKDAIHRAKQRKDKGEKWMTGGSPENYCKDEQDALDACKTSVAASEEILDQADEDIAAEELATQVAEAGMEGGKRRRRTMRSSRGRGRARGRTARRARGRTARRARGRASRRH